MDKILLAICNVLSCFVIQANSFNVLKNER